MGKRRDLFAPEWFPLYVHRVKWSDTLEGLADGPTGAFWKMIFRQWREGTLPLDPAEIARKVHAEVANVRVVLGSFPKYRGKSRRNKALEEIRAEQEDKHLRRVTAGRKGGKAKAKLDDSSSTRPDQTRLDKTRPDARGNLEADKVLRGTGDVGPYLVFAPNCSCKGYGVHRKGGKLKPCGCGAWQARRAALDKGERPKCPPGERA